MAVTRKSTRASTSAAPKYAETSPTPPNDESPPRNGKKTTRRKRARDDEDDVKADSPPAKKSANPKTKTSKPTSTKTAPPAPVSDTNRDANGKQEVYWLLKAEPLPRYENGINVAFSIDDLQKCAQPEPWTGVRNPQARNNMRAMRKGDLAFFYHSNAKPSGVVGIMRVVREAEVDETAFDAKDPYYDAKSERANPKWFCVGVEFVRKFDDVVDLHRIKGYAAKGGPLEQMQLVTNSRLSVSRVRREEWAFILGLAEAKEGVDGEGGGDAGRKGKSKNRAVEETTA